MTQFGGGGGGGGGFPPPPLPLRRCLQLPSFNVTRLTWPRWREVAAQNIWPVPEAVVTVLCTPVDGCGWYTKHVEWTCRIINRLLCVASHWTTINLLTHNDDYSGRTAPLTSKRCILCIYSTHLGTEYFKHGIYSPFFPLQNAVCFINLTYLASVLFAFYIQGVLKLKK